MPTLHRIPSLRPLSRLAAAALLLAPLGGGLVAQQVSAPTVTPRTTLNLDAPTALHEALASAADDESSASSSSNTPADTLLASNAGNLFAGAGAGPGADPGAQPPPYRRRRYGRPSYNDRFHNADGSNRIAVVAGGGFNVPVGSASSNYLSTSYRFEGGAGVNFNKKLGVLLQFDYDHFAVPGSILRNQINLYTNLTTAGGQTQSFAGLDGTTHIWSFTLNPTFNLYEGETVGAYAVVGGGFYHKVTDFTLPATGIAYSPYYGYYQYTANQTFDQYVSNAPGVTGGAGITYKFSRFANQRLFAEVRYVHTFNQGRLGDPSATGATTGTANNFYPPNSNETSYIPVTFGIRF